MASRGCTKCPYPSYKPKAFAEVFTQICCWPSGTGEFVQSALAQDSKTRLTGGNVRISYVEDSSGFFASGAQAIDVYFGCQREYAVTA